LGASGSPSDLFDEQLDVRDRLRSQDLMECPASSLEIAVFRGEAIKSQSIN
jgi:hypothetical protein